MAVIVTESLKDPALLGKIPGGEPKRHTLPLDDGPVEIIELDIPRQAVQDVASNWPRRAACRALSRGWLRRFEAGGVTAEGCARGKAAVGGVDVEVRERRRHHSDSDSDHGHDHVP